MERFRGVSLVLFLVAALVPVNYSYNILMVSPSHSKSHLIIASALLKGLAEEGHNVTMVSSFPQKEKIPNYRDVYLEVPQKLKKLFDDSLASESATYSLTSIKDMIVGIVDYANMTMGLPEFQRIMKEEQFDVVIAAPLGGNMFSGLAEHFHCPLVYFFPIRTMITHSYGAGNPLQISSVPSLFSSLGSAMTFRERVKNFLFTGFEAILFTVNDLIQWHYYNSNFPQPRYPSYHEASRNASLILSAHHFSQGPMANLPQIVEIGGIQMDTKLDPLPETLQKFLDEATEGAIFFSFGTNVQLKRQNPEKVSSILKALEKTGRKVLLKYDTEERIPGLSKNILTSSWVPQRTVLAHPNVKLFVTHGGLGSIMESKYYGVPVVGISVFADQHGNVAGAAKEGWGVALDMATLTEAKLTAALAEALGNSSYAETVKKLSDVYRDRPMGPMKTAIYWIEYVIRHQGAPQMRSPVKDLNFLQRYSADVIGLLVVVLLLFVIFLKFIVTLIFRLIKGAVLKVIRGSVGGDKKDK